MSHSYEQAPNLLSDPSAAPALPFSSASSCAGVRSRRRTRQSRERVRKGRPANDPGKRRAGPPGRGRAAWRREVAADKGPEWRGAGKTGERGDGETGKEPRRGGSRGTGRGWSTPAASAHSSLESDVLGAHSRLRSCRWAWGRGLGCCCGCGGGRGACKCAGAYARARGLGRRGRAGEGPSLLDEPPGPAAASLCPPRSAGQSRPSPNLKQKG